DCLENGLDIRPPDINYSEYRFKAVDDKKVYYALGAIKGIGQNVVDEIVAERNANGEFVGLIDFCRRVSKKVINKRTLENLIKAGCFDSLDANRNKLLKNLNKVIDFIEQEQLNANQGSLFDIFGDDSSEANSFVNEDISLDEYPLFNLKEQLTNEKQAIGYYLTASLFDDYHDIAKKLDIIPLSKFNVDDEDMQEIINARYAKHKPKVLIGGIINYMGSRPTKKGGKISFVKIEDASSELEFVVFNEQNELYKHLLKIDELVFIEGEVIYDSFRNEVKVNANKIMNLDDVLVEKVERVEFDIKNALSWKELKKFIISTTENPELIAPNILINYSNQTAKCIVRLSPEYKFMPKFVNFEEMGKVIGNNHWRMTLKNNG
ncbi:MAG: OB-fold nucleic acid binding domain-containing protein, partial [Burkholderiales bacterium]|nr:OB-fold nucleic acid binding domain-containing protein [Burkholderiales bacterium]